MSLTIDEIIEEDRRWQESQYWLNRNSIEEVQAMRDARTDATAAEQAAAIRELVRQLITGKTDEAIAFLSECAAVAEMGCTLDDCAIDLGIKWAEAQADD